MNTQKNSFLLRLALLTLVMGTWACIGTDIIDDEIVPKEIRFTSEVTSILIGEDKQLSATYFNEFGIQEEVAINWESSDPSIVSVDATGKITGVAEGQVSITAFGDGAVSAPLLIGVAGDINDVVVVQVSAPQTTLQLNATVSFSAKAFNINEDELTAVEAIVWASSNENVVTIDEDGLATAVGEGTTNITASIDGIQSANFELTVGTANRTATLQGVGSYNASGMVSLGENESGDLILSFSEDFQTDFALGTFIYLANSTNGQTVRSNGLDLGEVTSGGAKTFNVTSFDASAELDDYQYVIILCKPAGITFGFGELQ